MVCAFGFGVGGLALVGRGVCLQVWNGWVGVGQWWMMLWGWWVRVGRSWCVREGLGGGLGLVNAGVCFWVWGWWVGVGRSEFALEGLGFVG